jgi:hypothetical protein
MTVSSPADRRRPAQSWNGVCHAHVYSGLNISSTGLTGQEVARCYIARIVLQFDSEDIAIKAGMSSKSMVAM